MTGTDIAKSDLVYNGEIIHAKAEKLSLTDMWRAAGSPPNRDPAQWLRSAEAERFVSFLAQLLNMGNSHIGLVHSTRGGKAPGTWAHWQIGMNYARYLTPEFAAWCNEVVRDRMEGRAAETAHTLTRYDMSMIGSAVKNCTAVVLSEQLSAILPAMLDTMVTARLAEQSFMLRRGRTAGEVWRENGFPKIKITCWFSNRLVKMGCQIDGGGCGELGGRTAKLFDPDKARVWLDNGGRTLVLEYIALRQGQKVLRLVPKFPAAALGEGAPA